MYNFSHIVEYLFECPVSATCFWIFILHLKFSYDRKKQGQDLNIQSSLSSIQLLNNTEQILLCKITHLSAFTTFPTNHTPVIKFFPLKTARREETDNVGKHSGSRRIPHCGAHMWSVKSKYLPLISEKDSCQDKLTSFLNNMDVTGLIPCFTCKDT